MEKINKDFFDFIKNNSGKDTLALRLSLKNKTYNFDADFAITQIECRKKNKDKLKNFLSHPAFLFPDLISAEQASHQAVAQYHSSLAGNHRKILDMTAGLGIDAISMGEKNDVKAIELNSNKALVLTENSLLFDLKSFKVENTDSIEYLKNSNEVYDLIFVDPSRRDSKNQRVYNLKDCSPDIVTNQDLILQHAKRILIKASPLLDITQTLKDLHNIISIKAIGVKGECKEILVEMVSEPILSCSQEIKLEAINLDNEGFIQSHFSVCINKDQDLKGNNDITFASINDLKEGTFILEPSAMIMKLAPWSALCSRFNAKKLGKSSHIFLTSNLPENFPGRVTHFKDIIKKQDRKSLSGLPATVVSRNYPLSADELRKKFNIKEGDENFVYATRIEDKPIIFLSVKS